MSYVLGPHLHCRPSLSRPSPFVRSGRRGYGAGVAERVRRAPSVSNRHSWNGGVLGGLESVEEGGAPRRGGLGMGFELDGNGPRVSYRIMYKQDATRL